MDFEAKTIDEETSAIVDTYDGLVAPRRIWRNNNNKFYLAFKSIGAGYSKIRDVVLALKNRFDARYCSDSDLESAMFITGERRIEGKASIVRITAFNSNPDVANILQSGRYVFESLTGEIFTYMLATSTTIEPLGFGAMLFSSENLGSFPVGDAKEVKVVREDAVPVNGDFLFDTYDNAASLGRPRESDISVRQRLLTDTTRQDSLTELRTAIKALPSIFECNLIFNPSADNTITVEDGTLLKPKELLIILSGAPGQDFVDEVCKHTIYKTKMTDPELVVWYYNDLFFGGRYPVYYKNYNQEPFYLTIHYTFDRTRQAQEQVEAAFTSLLAKYKNMMTHIDEVNEPLLYKDLDGHGIPGVSLKKIYLQQMQEGQLTSVAEVKIPSLSMASLVTINFVAEEISVV